MNRFILLLLLFGLLCFSCNMNRNTEANRIDAGQVSTDTSWQELILPDDSGVVKINLTDGKGMIHTRKNNDQTIYIEFRSEGFKHISARLSSPDSLANIRFSQIIMPDSTMDGPFGMYMDYPLTMNGVYKISVHENMMAGDPWSGVFDVEIELTE